MEKTFLLLFFLSHSHLVFSFNLQNTAPRVFKYQGDDDPGQPLILTPYIQNGQIDQARSLSQVKGISTKLSYSGYFTVDPQYDSNMFFWFFPAQQGSIDAPVFLWLQGGPGGSSMLGLFVENGPLMVDANGQVKERNVTWNSYYHMLYIDNPVGTGFSFTNSSQGLSVDEDQVADNLYNALIQFFTVFTEYQKGPFYVTGESYAGKYIPAIGYKIHLSNPTAQLQINMVGLALGDAVIDPEHMITEYGNLLYNLGLADYNEAQYINDEMNKAVQYIQNEQYLQAAAIFYLTFLDNFYPYPSYFKNITGSSNHYNFLLYKEPKEFNYYRLYLNTSTVRQSIHVGSTVFNDLTGEVAEALGNDIMASQADHFTILLENYKILLYNGQLDIIVGAPLTENFMRQLKWSGQDDYLKAEKTVWKINSIPVGYVRQVDKFQQVVIRNAGHILPFDQPEVALAMIKNFVDNV